MGTYQCDTKSESGAAKSEGEAVRRGSGGTPVWNTDGGGGGGRPAWATEAGKFLTPPPDTPRLLPSQPLKCFIDGPPLAQLPASPLHPPTPHPTHTLMPPLPLDSPRSCQPLPELRCGELVAGVVVDPVHPPQVGEQQVQPTQALGQVALVHDGGDNL